MLGFNTDKRGNAPTGPVGPQNNTEQPVLLGFNTDKRGNAPTGPVGHDVILAGRGEMVDWPDLVGPHSSTEQSVFLGLDVDQVEHVSVNIVHPGVTMFRNQPVTDGPAGPDRTRHPVGTDGMHAVHDADRPTAGGPVGRLFSLDPMGPSGMSSSGDGNQPPAVGPVGKPFITGRLGDQVSEPDCRRTIQTRSESESDTGVPDPVIQMGSDVQTDRVNIGTAN